ncbi:MAG: prepilin-type N-terminal cleavage/methylation domain-containing protein [Chloroflexi bacterium]|nr:prepilin-type N-terminal cleavage/methylation domain-containing protein [Chloroflexota bacterium]
MPVISNQKSTIDNPESGATLIEVLVAVGILAAALMILVTALSTGSFAVRSADTLTTASNLAASQLESLKAQTYDASGATYTSLAAPPGYAVSIATNVITAGLQQITVTVTYQGGALAVSNFKVDR